MTLRLISHPDTPPSAVRAVTAELLPNGIAYAVDGVDALKLPGHERPRRTDGLWQTTCFELFLKSKGAEPYLEFNFSPSTQWAAYAFDGYRQEMRNLPLSAAPVIVRAGNRWTVTLSLAAVAEGPQLASVTAVIEEVDGTLSYWALAHPPGKPDFHHPDCFVLELPAPPAT